ncbi:hypothetical protein [Chromobacterium sp. CV08]|uniref:hypothetical protein n=1 Tax=Chromobacterium sp. CV08 TaxID=3133274 RepID=UPI003DA9755F
MIVLDTVEIENVSGAYGIQAGSCTLSNGGNNANTWYQTGVWATAGAVGGGITGVGAGFGAIGGAIGGFAGSFTLSCGGGAPHINFVHFLD